LPDQSRDDFYVAKFCTFAVIAACAEHERAVPCNKSSTEPPPRPGGEQSSPDPGEAGVAPPQAARRGAVAVLCCWMWKKQKWAGENAMHFPPPQPVISELVFTSVYDEFLADFSAEQGR
jgi:hypothetical protein